ncbi:hypothetical protein [Pectobacterium phage Lelidair]|uniref:HNH nuclease domain-containing protein n=1 Tax=Pectobacterium phage Lelidair TaxID=2320195 RepID=A0A385IFY4_9CAUD|nr:HNH endonuclease [Pectobacterium phage Lelidair]AXY81790.1 hypothetical protein [Pectobacterium phage Lelidair]
MVEEYLTVDATSYTGLRWIKRKGSGPPAGAVAFTWTASKGRYYCGQLAGVRYQAHRVVFFLTHGYWPVSVDHLDGNTLNNNPSNLRAATLSENQHNRVSKGFYYSTKRNKYHAQIKLHGVVKYLGSFDTEQEARSMYLQAKEQYHPTAPKRCYK